jgi:hypothetical protein
MFSNNESKYRWEEELSRMRVSPDVLISWGPRHAEERLSIWKKALEYDSMLPPLDNLSRILKWYNLLKDIMASISIEQQHRAKAESEDFVDVLELYEDWVFLQKPILRYAKYKWLLPSQTTWTDEYSRNTIQLCTAVTKHKPLEICPVERSERIWKEFFPFGISNLYTWGLVPYVIPTRVSLGKTYFLGYMPSMYDRLRMDLAKTFRKFRF